MFIFGLWLKMIFIVAMVSWSGILIKGLVTLYETTNLPQRFVLLIWKTKENISLQE